MDRFQLHSEAFAFYEHRYPNLDGTSGEPRLSQLSEALASDFNNLAVLSGELLRWHRPDGHWSSSGVVVVSTLAEAYVMMLRSAADLVGELASRSVCSKPGQAETTSLRSLLTWCTKNSTRIRPEARKFVESDWSWFWELRTLRDRIVHDGNDASIYSDRKAYYLFVRSATKGWIARIPLFPLLGRWTEQLQRAADASGNLVADHLKLSTKARRNFVLEGICVPSLAKFLSLAKRQRHLRVAEPQDFDEIQQEA